MGNGLPDVCGWGEVGNGIDSHDRKLIIGELYIGADIRSYEYTLWKYITR